MTRITKPQIAFLLLGTVAIWVLQLMLQVIHPGTVGVKWQRLEGTQLGQTYPPGLHVIAPWDKLFAYRISSQEQTTQFNALLDNGEPVDISLKLNYSPNVATLPLLHQQIGPDYAERVLIPEAKAILRYKLGQINEQHLCTLSSQTLEAELKNSINQPGRKQFSPLINVEKVSVTLLCPNP